MKIHECSLPVRQTGIRNNLIYNNIIQLFSNEYNTNKDRNRLQISPEKTG